MRKQGKDTYYYKVWLYVEGNDLPYVDYLIYTLNDSFPDPRPTLITAS